VPRLEAVSRLSWLREECDAVAALEPLTRRRDPYAFLAVKGARRLAPRPLAALRELHGWRERRAEETDIPAFKILGNEALLKLAEILPASASEIRTVPGVLPRLSAQADAILAAVKRAKEAPEAELPTLPRVVRPVVSEVVQKRIETLKAWRARKGQELGLDPSVLLPQRLIERVADQAPREVADLGKVEGLRRWRVEAFGNELLAALS
jgi:ribonuclease D